MRRINIFRIGLVGLFLLGLFVLHAGYGRIVKSVHAQEQVQEHAHDHDDHEGHDHAIEEEPDDHDDHEGHDHAIEEELDDHDDHEGHDHGEHEGESEEGLRLSPEQRRHYGIVIKNAGPGNLYNELNLPGEIVFNEDRVVHIVPRVSGIVRKVNKSVGDSVIAGEILAVIDSRELADTKAEYLAAMARESLAESMFNREKKLYEKKVSSEQDFLDAQEALANASIEFRAAKQKLRALGCSENELTELCLEQETTITRYEIKAPLDGIVTEKHISIGENLEGNVDIFTIVDLSSVWVNLTVYMKDLESVYEGQEVNLKVDHSGVRIHGKLDMITPFVDESTRSATARIVIDNSDGRWRPGTFVTGRISLNEKETALVVPLDAVQVIEDKSVVFVEHNGVFEMLPVQVGRSDRTHVEIVAGLERGTAYVAEGAFGLKATVVTSNLGSHAGHGH